MCYSKYFAVTIILIFSKIEPTASQGNCLIYPEDSGERTACELCYKAIEYRQGSKESQELFDRAIKIGPKYAWAYYEKSVPFFKRGRFAEGVSLLNKAIDLEPKNYLYYRAYWYFYNRSYVNAIKDLEQLYVDFNEYYSSTPSGEMEMRVILALAHAQSGDISSGIQWMQHLMAIYNEAPHLKRPYDHHCLGILHFKNGDYDVAETEFRKQIEINPNFADSYYYLGLVESSQSRQAIAQKYFMQALEKMDGKTGGYSINLFADYNVYRDDVKGKLETQK